MDEAASRVKLREFSAPVNHLDEELSLLREQKAKMCIRDRFMPYHRGHHHNDSFFGGGGFGGGGFSGGGFSGGGGSFGGGGSSRGFYPRQNRSYATPGNRDCRVFCCVSCAILEGRGKDYVYSIGYSQRKRGRTL